MPNLTQEEWSIRYHRDEIDSLRRQMGPGMLLTADGRLDIERRITENEQWLERWLERQRVVATPALSADRAFRSRRRRAPLSPALRP